MTNAETLLVTLIRAAFDKEDSDESCRDSVSALCQASADDWQQAIDLSFDQGVDVITVDGYNRILGDAIDSTCLLETEELEDLKFEWFGSVLQVEEENRQQKEAALKLAENWRTKGIRTYVLKGLSVAQYYPEPNHRSCCDFDCFLLNGSDGTSAYEEGNVMVENLGVEVHRSYYKNSSFNYKGLHVENHQFCTPIRGERRRKEYESFLREIIREGASEIEGTDMLCPSPLFNLLFLTSHAQIHFITEGGITLRHVCDWAVIMRQYASLPVWEIFAIKCREFGLWKFACSMSQVARKVTGIEIPFDCPVSEEADRRLLEELLNSKKVKVDFSNAWGSRIECLHSILHSGWKYRLYSDTSMIADLITSVWSFFFEKRPEISHRKDSER